MSRVAQDRTAEMTPAALSLLLGLQLISGQPRQPGGGSWTTLDFVLDSLSLPGPLSRFHWYLPSIFYTQLSLLPLRTLGEESGHLGPSPSEP